MNIQISKEAAAWYKEELGLANGDYLRFFARYGGCSNVQSGFSLGVSSEDPINLAVKKEAEGIIFYIEEKDEWYFDEHDLVIELPADSDEPVIEYKKQSTPEM
ncbi:HesB/YadR/YfhF family protein [Bacillus sp. UNC438CL73TsuS30]|uniref:HesB/YadR/YfhF family protein n=1 Tax=Bacillus sp. UNC438CL73TsuS30 TaxID=1340434 RepID=UPI00047E758D|nr:HesB/YadR/YfhF family protein [Bacillus sp. UNC438CL73TsuS30]